jgi:hypothetical protein
MQKNPPTKCEKCRWAEMTRWERVKEWLSIMFMSDSEKSLGYYSQSMSSMISAAMGAKSVVTMYEVHKQAYIRTGDEIELKRMERHV